MSNYISQKPESKVKKAVKIEEWRKSAERFKSRLIHIDLDGIPASLKTKRNWVAWRLKPTDSLEKPFTKPPFNCAGGGGEAATDDPTTWATFERAAQQYRDKNLKSGGGLAGLGIVVREELVGIDLDNCRDPDTGVIEPWAADLIKELNSYTELSPSGTGIRILIHGKMKPEWDRNRFLGTVEIYDESSPRYLTLTGHHLAGTPTEVHPRQEQLEAVYQRLDAEHDARRTARKTDLDKLLALRDRIRRSSEEDEAEPVVNGDVSAIVEVASRAANGDKFKRLWNGDWQADYDSESQADMALCSMLAFYVGPDAEALDGVFRASPYYDAKDGKHVAKWEDREDYREATLKKAIDERDEFYDWTAAGTDARVMRRLDELFDTVAAERDAHTAEETEPVPSPVAAPTAAPIAAPASQTAGEDRRQFQDANEILALPDPVWLIEDILMEGAFGMIFGLPGCFKTFFALDMALSLAHGLPFLGNFPVAGEVPVAYITPEGTTGLKGRLRGWMQTRGIDRLRNIKVNRHAFRLTETEEVEAVVKQLALSGTKPKVLFVDTLARNFGAGDENSTKDMNHFVNNVLELAAQLGMAAMVVHHSGKDAVKGARGSIALTGAVDVSIELTKPQVDGATTATVRCRKQKDAEEFPAFVVAAERVSFGESERPSIVLRYDGQPTAEDLGDKSQKAVTVDTLKPLLTSLEGGPLKVSQIETATGASNTTIRRYLGWATKYEYAAAVPNSVPQRYELSHKGKTQVEAWKVLS